MKIKTASYFSVSVIFVLAFFVFTVAFFGFLPQAQAESSVNANQRLVTIYDRGEERSVITSKTTLRAVFEEIGLAIDGNDIVEPGLDEELVGKDYRVNIYRARPIVIQDGLQQIKVMSAYQTPRQIAEQAGVMLRDEDEAEMTQSTDLLTDGASLRLVVKRATPVKLTLYGTTETIYTQATTVGELLKQKHITLSSNDTLSVPRDQTLVSNIKVEIWRNGKQTVTKEESIAFPVEQIQDTDREIGYHEVKTAGLKGKKVVTYEITMKNGKQKSKRVIQKVVIKKPKKQVEIVGVKVSLPAGSHEDWMRKGGISSGNFGYVHAIFSQESGWNPAARNPVGYVGLGQTSETNLSRACPSWQSDPICQIRFFNGYAVSRYGSWQAAYAFKFGANGQGGHGWW